MKEYPTEGARLRDYEAFLAVVETGNLTRAANHLHRSLQSVSRSLAGLEEHLGVVLVRRTTRSAQPTDAGRGFHERLSGALREIGLAEAEIRDASGALSGTVRLAGSAFFVGRYVVPAIRDFSLRHAGVKFDLRISEEFQGPNGVNERVAVKGPFEADNAYVTNQAAIAGIGIAVAPFFQIREAIEAGHVEIVLADFALSAIPVHAIFPSDSRTPARARRFVDLLAQRLKKEIV